MKTKIIIAAVAVFGSLYSGAVRAQQTALLADQNPRYKESQAKYARAADSLTSLQGTTIQDTYKAYDWYEAKLERRRQNHEWRHQERMNGYFDYTPSWGLYDNYYSPSINFGFGGRWGRGGYHGGRSGIGIGFGWY
ncbi:hypothetical protein [Mucilaginibacter sp. OK283]|jgi:hypothetical protein|uniref:hypothetical protein n=1 Tax=Mucilaginibacter sp. OK283 TaxID=1881049 RepID=UPI0008ADE947|nr:hypothetical protein [Mucilaginibacter sp. OK283]SEO11650.1 hypothetical protein SAMN05428947_101359 [Mucilaginibacter sp. OK283]